MEKDCYKEIIEELSKKLAEKVCSEETGLATRARTIDQDIQGLVQEIGFQTTQSILEATRDKIASKKNLKG